MTSARLIKAIILYGSHARGDATNNSDLDICVFYTGDNKPTDTQVHCLAPNLEIDPQSLVSYPEKTIEEMLRYGSLFLWHIKLEGKFIYGEEYVNKTLKKLKPFIRHHDEIEYHQNLLSDLVEAQKYYWQPNEFDLSLMFTIARNTCMVLAHKKGQPAFGRLECYETAAKLYPNIPFSKKQYIQLAQWKMIYERNSVHETTLPTIEEVSVSMNSIKSLLDYANAKTK